MIEVLSRPRFYGRLGNVDLNAFLRVYQAYARSVMPDPAVRGVCDDEEDDLVLGAAIAAHADYLVTGDAGLLRVGEYRGVRIVNAATFLDILERRAGQAE